MQSPKTEYYIRVESSKGYFSFYTIEAPNKSDAEKEAKKRFVTYFGGQMDEVSIGYTWDPKPAHF